MRAFRKWLSRIYLTALKSVVKRLRRRGTYLEIQTRMGCRYLAIVCFVNRLLPVNIAGLSLQELKKLLLEIDPKLRVEESQLLVIRNVFLRRKGLAGYVR